MIMEEFISNLIHSSSSFIGGRTFLPGPVPTSSSRVRGPVVLSSADSTAGSSKNQIPTATPAKVLKASNNDSGNVNPSTSTQSDSIIRTDMNPMIAWLTSQTSCNDSPSLNSSVSNSEVYTSEDFSKRIPKPYNELNERDCAVVVAQAIRSIVLHTCNDNFRQQCFTKLGASNSRDVELEVKSRLNAIILQQEEEQNQTDADEGESTEMETVPSQSENTTMD